MGQSSSFAFVIILFETENLSSNEEFDENCSRWSGFVNVRRVYFPLKRKDPIIVQSFTFFKVLSETKKLSSNEEAKGTVQGELCL